MIARRSSSNRLLRYLPPYLPTGRPLQPAVFEARHRGILLVLWLHVPALGLFAVFRGYGVAHALAEASLVAGFAAAGTVLRSRGLRSLMTALVWLWLRPFWCTCGVVPSKGTSTSSWS